MIGRRVKRNETREAEKNVEKRRAVVARGLYSARQIGRQFPGAAAEKGGLD